MINQSNTIGLCMSCTHRETDSYGRIRCKLQDIDIYNVEECESYTQIKARETGMDFTGINIAGRGKRFMNYILDSVFALVLFFTLVFFAAISDSELSWLKNASELEWNILASLTLFVYYIYFESVFNVTPGKLITGTRVVGEDCNRPALRKILLRSLCRYIPFEPLSLFGDKAIGWHDSLSGTLVIDSRKKKPEGKPEDTRP